MAFSEDKKGQRENNGNIRFDSYSPDMGCFALLHPSIRTHLSGMGLRRPTPAQALAIRPIIEGRNVLLLAPTGTGKTEAVILPIMHRILTDRAKGGHKGVYALYITPLRALNRDLMKRLRQWGESLDITIGVRHGDTPVSVRRAQSKNPPEILITTPETLQVLMSGKVIMKALNDLKSVIVDEVHELASTSRGAQMSIGLERLGHMVGHDFQRIGLSATVGNVGEVAGFVLGSGGEIHVLNASAIKRYDVAVRFARPTRHDRDIAKALNIEAESAALVRVIAREIERRKALLAFTNTRQGAEFIGTLLPQYTSEPIGVHHGSLSRQLRIELEDRFKANELKALIATSSLELGIDIGQVDFIVQCTSPRTVSRLLQRMGRSGHRFGATARGLCIGMNFDDIVESLVIIEEGMNGRVEPARIRSSPLDSLANQIAAHLYVSGETRAKELYAIIRGSYVYRGLEWGTYLRVLRELCKSRVIAVPDDEVYRGLMDMELDVRDFIIRPGRKQISYFYSNISMIPDEGYYRAVNIVNGRYIGKLDESFVMIECEPGAKIVLGGASWRVVDIRTEGSEGARGDTKGPLGTVLMEPLSAIGDLPRWVGEEIPVPFKIAMKVGAMRRHVVAGGTSLGVGKHISPKDWEYFTSKIKAALKKGFKVATDRDIVIEGGKGVIVINATFGHRTNTTLAHIVAPYITQRTGSINAVNIDAYRAILFFDGVMNPEAVKDYLMGLDQGEIKRIVTESLIDSSRFKWTLYHTARKFGAIMPSKGAGTYLSRMDVRRLIKVLDTDTIVQEAIDKEVFQHLDIETCENILEAVNKGEIKIWTSMELSPVSMAGSFYAKGVISPEHADRQMLDALKNRLLNTVHRGLCLRCASTTRLPVREVYGGHWDGKCGRCGSTMIALLPLREEEGVGVVEKYNRRGEKALKREEEALLKRLYKNANVVNSHPKWAAILLAARGIGVDTAARIIYNLPEPEDEIYLLREIMRAEITYARTKRFWD